MRTSEFSYVTPDGTKFTFRLNYVWRWRDLIPTLKLWVKWLISPRERQELEQQAKAIARMLVALALVAREASRERKNIGG